MASGHGESQLGKHRAPFLWGFKHFLSLHCRAHRKQPGLAGVRVPDPQAHPAALCVPAGRTPADHSLWPQWHRENLPGQPAVRVPGASGGTGANRRGHRHLQRGPQVQQGEEVVWRLLLSQGSLFCSEWSMPPPPWWKKQHFLHSLLWWLQKPCEGGQNGASRREGSDPGPPSKKLPLYINLAFSLPHYEPGIMLGASSFLRSLQIPPL